MALRCLNFVKNISQNKVYVTLVRHNLMCTSNTPKEKLASIKEYKTENNLTYQEDPDAFGTLSSRPLVKEDIFKDEGDIREENFQSARPLKFQQLTIKQYADIIKQYLEHKRLKEAIDILEVRMLKEDRVKPDNYIYNILIGACADVGYTKKAFKLFNDMKKRTLLPTGDTYTCLFEACINSPWKENGLKYARNLRNLMIEKGIEPNLTNYNVMIKAFGRCGDLPMAFKIVDEMISKKIKIRVHTLNHLLHACISDKDSGLRHALIVWRKMLHLREKPNIYSFNLMLRCVKECNLGSKEDVQELIGIIQNTQLSNKHLSKPLQIDSVCNETSSIDIKLLPTTNESNRKLDNVDSQHNRNNIALSNSLIPSSGASSTDVIVPNENITLSFIDTNNLPTKCTPSVPNLLSNILHLDQVCGLQEIQTVQDKFAIIGGQDDFLQQMALYSVKPDIKTFTQMLSVIDDNTQAEDKLISSLKSMNVKPDIDFYNMLIKKRCLRLDYDSAFAVKEMIEQESKKRKGHPLNKKNRINVNIMTYGTLAMACKSKEDGKKLLNEMKEKQLKINIQILGALLKHGTIHMNFGYILYIMEIIKQENLKVNHMIIKQLECFNERCETLIKKYNEEQKESVLTSAYNRFSKLYRKWLKEVNIEDALKNEDPWQQFTEPHPETVQREKFEIVEPRKFYKRNRKFVAYSPRI